MVILSKNPYTTNASDIINIKIEKTIFNGEEFSTEKGSFIRPILRGIFSSNKA